MLQLGIPYQEVLCKNRYVGRTFIQPSMRLRQLAVAKKFGPLIDNFKDKKIVLLDDSIVRGNTMRAIVRLLKTSGAKEVRTNYDIMLNLLVLRGHSNYITIINFHHALLFGFIYYFFLLPYPEKTVNSFHIYLLRFIFRQC